MQKLQKKVKLGVHILRSKGVDLQVSTTLSKNPGELKSGGDEQEKSPRPAVLGWFHLRTVEIQ